MIRNAMLYVMSLMYVATGSLHFIVPAIFTKIVPPLVPYPLAMVYISGGAEILLGLALLWKRLRPFAAWGIIMLLVAVFPANIYMAIAHESLDVPVAIALGRLPLQFLFIFWALMYTRKEAVNPA